MDTDGEGVALGVAAGMGDVMGVTSSPFLNRIQGYKGTSVLKQGLLREDRGSN